jgi:hypothetical protein
MRQSTPSNHRPPTVPTGAGGVNIGGPSNTNLSLNVSNVAPGGPTGGSGHAIPNNSKARVNINVSTTISRMQKSLPASYHLNVEKAPVRDVRSKKNIEV